MIEILKRCGQSSFALDVAAVIPADAIAGWRQYRIADRLECRWAHASTADHEDSSAIAVKCLNQLVDNNCYPGNEQLDVDPDGGDEAKEMHTQLLHWRERGLVELRNAGWQLTLHGVARLAALLCVWPIPEVRSAQWPTPKQDGVDEVTVPLAFGERWLATSGGAARQVRVDPHKSRRDRAHVSVLHEG